MIIMLFMALEQLEQFSSTELKRKAAILRGVLSMLALKVAISDVLPLNRKPKIGLEEALKTTIEWFKLK